MDVFHVFKIVQMVPNRAKHHIKLKVVLVKASKPEMMDLLATIMHSSCERPQLRNF